MIACVRPPLGRSRDAGLAEADATLLQGCYDCLIEARSAYRRVATGARRAALVSRVFEADLLIALREKELGLPASDALAEARRIAVELPPELAASRYLTLVDAVPPEQLGLPRRETDAFVAAHASVADRIGAELRWLATGRLRKPVRDYLRISLACAYPDPANADVRGGLGDDRSDHPDTDGSPLLAYRAEICDLTRTSSLVAVRAREPRFIETSFFLANTEVASFASAGAGQIKAHLAEVVARFPTSPAVNYLAASYARLIGDCAQALPLYDRTLAAQPAHDQALLGRAICLTTLQRPQDAILTATHLIELDPNNIAEAYYWRAWNHHTLTQLSEARRDITLARQLLAEPYVLALAGVIAYDQRDLDAAQADLEVAIAGAPTDCVARQYLALTQQAHRRWQIAGVAFEAAMACYRARAQDGRSGIDALRSQASVDPVYRARELARLEAAVENDSRQARRSSLAAASCHATSGNVVTARNLLEFAAEEPTLLDGVARLRRRLDAAMPLRR